MKNDTQLKQEMMELFFENEVRRYQSPIDRKYVDVVLVSKNKSLGNYFGGLYKKYRLGRKMAFNDFMLEFAVFHTYETVMKFEIRNDGQWHDLVDGYDPNNNMGMLIRTIKNTCDGEIIKFVNDGLFMTSKMIDGEKKHIGLNISFSSLDKLSNDSGEGETTILNLLSDDTKFWGEKGNQLDSNAFIEWFRENKKRLLTNSQYNLLVKLEQIGYGTYEARPTDLENIIGFPVFKLNTKLQTIAVRVAKAWEREGMTVNDTQLARQVKAEVGKWTELYDVMASNENTETMNQEVSNFFLSNIDNNFVNALIYDKLDGKDSSSIVASYQSGQKIESKIIYKLMKLVEVRLDKLQLMDTSSVPFYKTEKEMGKFTPAYHKECNAKRKAFIEAPCMVYKKLEDGTLEFIREEKYVAKEPIQYFDITSTGVQVPVNEHGE